MQFNRRIGRHLGAALVVLAGMGQALAASPALTKVGDIQSISRPTNVPLDYVVTPHGFFHPSCVVEVGENDEVADNGDVLRANGTVSKSRGCAYPRFTAKGAKVFGNDKTESDVEMLFSGWVASSNSDTNQTPPAKKMTANFTVPSGPKTAGTQVLYFFPGLEASVNLQTILQPVLGWNAYGEKGWSMTNWNCCKDGQVFHGDRISTDTGHKIHGSMKGSKCVGDVCSKWAIVSADKTSGQKTKFVTDGYGQAFNWYFGGVLEVYYVDTCSQYPANGSIKFTNIHVYGMNGAETTPANWNKNALSDAPSCGVKVEATKNATTISWSPGL